METSAAKLPFLFVFCFSISGTSLNLIRGLFAKESGGLAGQDDDEQREGEGIGEHGNIPVSYTHLDVYKRQTVARREL